MSADLAYVSCLCCHKPTRNHAICDRCFGKLAKHGECKHEDKPSFRFRLVAKEALGE